MLKTNSLYIKSIFFLAIILQASILTGLIFIIPTIKLVFPILLLLLAFYRPLLALYLFFTIIVTVSIGSYHINTSLLISLYITVILGVYSSLFFRDSMKLKHFLVKINFHSFILILIYFYILSLIVGIIGQPLYSFVENINEFSYIESFIKLLNATQKSPIYPIKATFIILESVLIGLYVFGTLKISNKKISLLKEKRKIVQIALASTLLIFTIFSYPINTNKTNSRLQQWNASSEMILLNPLYGTGFGSFEWKAKKLKNEGLKVENLYLDTMVGAGLVGFTFFISAIFMLFFKMLRKTFFHIHTNIILKLVRVLLFASFTLMLIYANFTSMFSSYPGVTIFWLLVFIILSFTYSNKIKHVEKIKMQDFFNYMNYIFVYLMILHFLNFTIVKKYFEKFLTQHLTILNETYTTTLISFLLLGVFITVFSSLILHIATILFSNSNNILIDKYGKDKLHASHNSKVPRAGGIGIYLANFFLLFNPIGLKLILVSLPVFIIGLVDDFKDISAKVRLIFQAISALLAIYLLHAYISPTLFTITIPTFVVVAISFIAIVGITNAMNIIDGLNGLTGGVAFMVFISLGTIALYLEDMVIFEIVTINLMALVGFLIMNFPKAKIFLGDGGAYFIGFSLAVISFILLHNHSEISFLYPFTLLIYPIWEVLFSIYRRRIVQKGAPTQADNMHLHQLLYRHVVKNNPKTTLYILIRVLPFVLLTTLFYNNDTILFLIIYAFISGYTLLYKHLVQKFQIN